MGVCKFEYACLLLLLCVMPVSVFASIRDVILVISYT